MKRNNARFNNNKQRQQRFGGGGHGHRRHGSGQKPQSGTAVPDRRMLRRAQELKEKYFNQARDALSGGDRVTAEYYFQHADHYFRVAKEIEDQIAEFEASRAAEAGADNVVDLNGALPEEGETSPLANSEDAALPEEIKEGQQPEL